jgi:hypothetical protein
MDFLTHLWLPILLSGLAVWFVSAICWMAIGHHNNDNLVIPDENRLIDLLKSIKLPPGNYQFPDYRKCKEVPKEQRRAAMDAMFKSGEMGQLRVWADMNMGVNMFLTFSFFLVTSFVLAYFGWAVLPHGGSMATTVGDTRISMGLGPTFANVFRFFTTAAVLAYCFATFPNDLWFQKSKRGMLMNFIDGVIFSLITGAIFAYFWPK